MPKCSMLIISAEIPAGRRFDVVSGVPEREYLLYLSTLIHRRLNKAATRGVPKKKVFLNISQFSKKNTCARVSLSIKLHLRPATLLQKRFLHRCFPFNFAKF